MSSELTIGFLTLVDACQPMLPSCPLCLVLWFRNSLHQARQRQVMQMIKWHKLIGVRRESSIMVEEEEEVEVDSLDVLDRDKVKVMGREMDKSK